MRATRIAAGLVVFYGLLQAHDPSLHRTKSVTGQVISCTGNGAALKTRSGPIKVLYSGKTRFELNKRPAAKDQIHPGDWIGVVGNEQHSGELLATDVILGLPSPGSGAQKQ
jgi:hypothetical protein